MFCAELRSKKLALLRRLPVHAGECLDESRHCWCYHTQQEFGPDGGKVAAERCTEGRECYRSPIDEGEGRV